MKEIWDQIVKIIPAEALPALVLIAAVFFGVYYAKGLRSYTDAINDRWFLTAIVLIIAVFAVLWVQKTREPDVEKGSKVALLVPRFEGDEARNIERLFVQEVRAAVHAIQPQAAVIQFDGYVLDLKTAALTARNYNSAAVIFEPKVVRLTDKILICFSVFTANPQTTKPYTPTSAQIEKSMLDDIANTVLTFYSPSGSPRSETLAARIDALERRMSELAAAVSAITTSNRTPSAHLGYPHKRAVVVGINDYEQGRMPKLRYASSDATSIARLLQEYGFNTTLILDGTATKAAIMQAVDHAVATAEKGDLILFYYAGNSFPSNAISRSQTPAVLILPSFDVDLEHPLSSITLPSIVERLKAAVTANKLIILDGCHGTYGLAPSLDVTAGAAEAYSFQIIAGSQDNEVAFELPEVKGGAFTQTLLKLVTAQKDPARGLSTKDILSGISVELARLTAGKQSVKLLTLSGKDDIVLSATAGSPAAR